MVLAAACATPYFCLFVYRPPWLCPSIPKDRAYGHASSIHAK